LLRHGTRVLHPWARQAGLPSAVASQFPIPHEEERRAEILTVEPVMHESAIPTPGWRNKR